MNPADKLRNYLSEIANLINQPIRGWNYYMSLEEFKYHLFEKEALRQAAALTAEQQATVAQALDLIEQSRRAYTDPEPLRHLLATL
jgi:hypothetical protein